jgi:hypothetical protein
MSTVLINKAGGLAKIVLGSGNHNYYSAFDKPRFAYRINSGVQTVALTSFSADGANEVQTVALTGFADTDSFKVTFGGNESAEIIRGTNYDAAGIKAAIEAITDFAGTVTVSAVTDEGFVVTFGGGYALTNVGDLSITSAVGCSGEVTTTTAGAAGDSFKLTFGGNESEKITKGINYDAESIKAIIEAITGFPTEVTISGISSSGFVITMAGEYGDNVIATGPFTVTTAVGCSGTVSQPDTVNISVGNLDLPNVPIADLTVNDVAITSSAVFATNIAVVFP